ncbi:hypothetical protein V8C35DRAFT_306908 [Trichoderma chlorosporum]
MRGKGGRARQRNGWNQSPRRGGNFAFHDAPVTAHNVAFTLLDEARQTSHHDSSFWSNNTQLRKRPVIFVSSGTHDPLLPPETQTDSEKQSPESAAAPEEAAPEETPPKEASPVETILETLDEERLHVQTIHDEPAPEEFTPKKTTIEELIPEETAVEEVIHEEIIDEETVLEETIPEETPEETTREETAPKEAIVVRDGPEEEANEHLASQDDTSSDEVIVFKGRKAMKSKTQDPGITLTSMKTEIRAVEKQIAVALRGPPTRPTLEDDSDDLLRPRNKRNKSRKWRNREKDEDEEAMIADYIANMRENGEMFEGMESEDGSGSGSTEDEAEAQPSASAGPDNAEKVEVYSEADSPDLDDLEELGDFDFMDWERPSLRGKKGKGRRLQLLPDGMDSDLEEKLQSAFNNDRLKKAQRKKEREELRAMGLLGKKGQVDLRAKYSTGITMSQVADEIKAFLIGSQETLNLPPMDKRTRKMVHELANKFDIKSKSIGAGEQRRPVLYRTKKTTYKEVAFEQAVMRIKRQYSRSSQPSTSKQNRQKGSNRNDAGTSYRDGEIIGASAPELGSGNRGRTMLEKMGWSTGTPLGASDNQGILQPVSQTMKRTRAGLGQE